MVYASIFCEWLFADAQQKFFTVIQISGKVAFFIISMTNMPLDHFQLQKNISQLTDANLLRHTKAISTGVTPYLTYKDKTYLNFASNDYLGLAQHPAVSAAMIAHTQQHGVGSGASHLVSGHFTAHEALEKALAAATGYEAAMLFSSGFMANMGVIPALLGRHDAAFCDALNHASLIDGVRLSKAEKHIYPHLDMAALEKQLQQSKAQKKLMITDHVFSMDGTVADMQALTALAKKYEAGLLIDDAHGFGVQYGQAAENQHKADIYMATLGKSLGCYGAFVAGSQELITYLKTKARSYVFTTALPTALAVAALAALQVINETNNTLHKQLADNIAQLRAGLLAQGWQMINSHTAVQPVIIGEETSTLALAQKLQEAGFWVIAIRPPTVPAGTCRLRITLSASHTGEHIAALLSAMKLLSV